MNVARLPRLLAVVCLAVLVTGYLPVRGALALAAGIEQAPSILSHTGPRPIRSSVLARADSQHSLTAHAAASRAPGLSMSVEAGYGGDFRLGAWVPVRVRVSNQGPTVSGNLSILDDGRQATTAVPANLVTYTRSVEMPQGGIKDFTLYIPGADLGNTLTISLSAGSAGVLVRSIPLTSVSSSTLLVGVLSRDRALFTQIRGLGGLLAGSQVVVVPLDARRLDAQPLALANLDAIVLGDFTSSELSGDQLSALEAWVRGGGTLITLGGPSAQATLSGLPASLRLVRLEQPVILQRIPGLAALGGPLPAGASVAAIGQQLAGEAVLTVQSLRTAGSALAPSGTPLVVQRALGLGTVLYSALDPMLGPLSTWNGLPRFWSLLAAPIRAAASTLTSLLAGTIQSPQRGDTMDAEIDNVSPPSITLFIVLLGLYVVVLVPLNFVLLGYFKRRDWSWVTLPAMAVILVLITFGSAYFGRGSNVRTSVVSVVFLTSGSDHVIAQSYVGLFSPLAGDYTLTPDNTVLGSALFSAQNGGSPGSASSVPLAFTQDTGQVRLPKMNMWSSRNSMFTASTVFHGGLDGVLHLTPNGHLVGDLTNHSSYLVHSAAIVAYDGQPQGIGDIAPGRSIHVDITTGGAAQSGQSLGDFYGQTAFLPTTPSDPSRKLALVGPQPAATQSTRPRSLLPLHPHLHPAHPVRSVRSAHSVRSVRSVQSILAVTPSRAQPSVPLAVMHAPLAPLLDAGRRLVADANTIPTNPAESPSARFQHVLDQVLGTLNPAMYGSVLLIGWTAEPVLGFRVNGDRPARQDTTLLLQSLPVTVPPGPFSLNAGVLPARLSGSEMDMQQGFGTSGLSISSNSNATFVAQLPLPAPGHGHLVVHSLTLTVASNGAGGAIDSQTAALYDWQNGTWVSVDVTNGQVDVRRAARFVNAAGLVRVRISARDATLGINDPYSGVSLGASGVVQ